MPFSGFPSGRIRHTPIPAAFFTDLLPEIDHLGELKVTLYFFWRLDRMEANPRFLRPSDLAADRQLMAGMGTSPRAASAALQDALERATLRGALLKAELTPAGSAEPLYFLNSPKGRAALEGLRQGHWAPEGLPHSPIELALERPNIFHLYETHFGPLTPMLAEALRDAEATYPPSWIEDAIRISVENNVRRWRYVEAILRSWQEEGKDDRKDRRNAQEDPRRYITGKFAAFIEH